MEGWNLKEFLGQKMSNLSVAGYLKFEDYLYDVLGEVGLWERQSNLMRQWYMSEGNMMLTTFFLQGCFYYTRFVGGETESQESL